MFPPTDESIDEQDFVNIITEHLFGVCVAATPDKLQKVRTLLSPPNFFQKETSHSVCSMDIVSGRKIKEELKQPIDCYTK